MDAALQGAYQKANDFMPALRRIKMTAAAAVAQKESTRLA
jgi:hypothetical protein